jgi:hypothetical protein
MFAALHRCIETKVALSFVLTGIRLRQIAPNQSHHIIELPFVDIINEADAFNLGRSGHGAKRIENPCGSLMESVPITHDLAMIPSAIHGKTKAGGASFRCSGEDFTSATAVEMPFEKLVY